MDQPDRDTWIKQFTIFAKSFMPQGNVPDIGPGHRSRRRHMELKVLHEAHITLRHLREVSGFS